MNSDIHTQALQLPLQERLALIQSLLASIQTETQQIAEPRQKNNDAALEGLSPWVRSLVGVIEDTGEPLEMTLDLIATQNKTGEE